MRFLLAAVFVAVGVCLASSHSIGTDDGDRAKMQKQIWRLFRYVNQPLHYNDLTEIAKAYSLEDNLSKFSKPEVVRTFMQYMKYDYFLPRGRIFSVFYDQHLDQAKALFKLLYHAQDYDTFYKTAVWARQNVNEGVFLYAFSVAILHRPDTHFIVLPPIYEVYPYYFFGSEAVNMAQYYKQLYWGDPAHSDRTIPTNSSGYYLNLQPEQSMSYYTEDPEYNAFYYYYHLYYPFWMCGDDYNLRNDNRGELFYYLHQQILARYYLERLSNGFGEVDYLDWDVPLKSGYVPSLTYPNGLEFPTRPNYVNLHEYFYNYGQKWSYKGPYGYSHSLIHDYEERIKNAIDAGFVYGKDGKRYDLFKEEGLDLLGTIIDSNPESRYRHYYGAFQAFARHLLGYSYQPMDYHRAYPSVLEHFETSLRDPVFYMLYKKLVLYFQRYKYYLKPYMEKDLHFEGVKIERVEFDRLITYFDRKEYDITNAVYLAPQEMEKGSFRVRAVQPVLHHKPFTYRIHVQSDKSTACTVRVFIGPKWDEYGRPINISENRVNFVQFDHFRHDLKAGANVISRSSKDVRSYMHDRDTYDDHYQHTFQYYNSDRYNFDFNPDQILFGFPHRLMLPKGTHGGYEYQFYVIVSPYVPYKHERTDYNHLIGTGTQYVDGYSFGYPFDRHIKFEKMFCTIPNSYFYETKIYNRHVDDVNM